MHNPCTIHAPEKPGPGLRHLCLAALTTLIAGPVIAQEATATLDQMQRKYRRMNVVHIEKCDRGRDGLFDNAEQLCVSSIYDVMYRDND